MADEARRDLRAEGQTAGAHVLYTAADFTAEELDRRNVLAVMVVKGGLDVCKRCGASEAGLSQHATCASYRHAQKQQREAKDKTHG